MEEGGNRRNSFLEGKKDRNKQIHVWGRIFGRRGIEGRRGKNLAGLEELLEKGIISGGRGREAGIKWVVTGKGGAGG